MATKRKIPDEYLIQKLAPVEANVEGYAQHERALRTYNAYLAGYTEDEIAAAYGIKVAEVKRDIMHVQASLPPRTLIQHHNERTRILVQREYSENFRKLLGRALELPPTQYLTSGVNPSGILKEYREATGMTSREPLIAIQQNINQSGGSGGPSVMSAVTTEDIIRRVLDEEAKRQVEATQAKAIDAIAEESEAGDPAPEDGDSEDPGDADACDDES